MEKLFYDNENKFSNLINYFLFSTVDGGSLMLNFTLPFYILHKIQLYIYFAFPFRIKRFPVLDDGVKPNFNPHVDSSSFQIWNWIY